MARLDAEGVADYLSDQSDRVDEIAERFAEGISARAAELAREPGERDPDLWGEDVADLMAQGAPIDESVIVDDWDDLSEVPPRDRGIDWDARMAVVRSLSHRQAWLESGAPAALLAEATRQAEDRARTIPGVPNSELKGASITRARREAARARRAASGEK